MKYRRATLGFS